MYRTISILAIIGNLQNPELKNSEGFGDAIPAILTIQG